MKIITNEKMNFNSLEENTFKKMMELGRSLIRDELLEINSIGQYSQSIVEMIVREITKKSYRETAKTVSEDTDSTITYTAVRNIVISLGKKIKQIEEKVREELAKRE